MRITPNLSVPIARFAYWTELCIHIIKRDSRPLRTCLFPAAWNVLDFPFLRKEKRSSHFSNPLRARSFPDDCTMLDLVRCTSSALVRFDAFLFIVLTS